MLRLDLTDVLLGLVVFAIVEGAGILLRRLFGRLPSPVAFHLAAFALAFWLTFGDTEWARQDPWSWQLVCTSTLTLIVWALYSIFDRAVLQRPWRPEAGPMAPALVRGLGLFVVLFLSLLLAARVIHGLGLPTVLVSSTVVSAVLGLALQDLLKNVFSGMALQLEGSLRVGEWIDLDGRPARIVDVSWRSVRLVDNQGVTFLEPNSEMSDRRLKSYGSGSHPVGFLFEVGLPYGSPPAKAKAALLAAAKSAPEALSDPQPQAMVDSYGDSAITYQLRVWTRHVQAISQFRDGVFSRIWYQLQRVGIEVPFPIRTVHFHDMEKSNASLREQEQERLVSLLADLDLFDGLERSVLRRFLESAERGQFDHGEVLVREGDSGDALFVIERGQVIVSKAGRTDATGRLQLASLSAGDFFGEMSLLTGEQRSATVRADGGCAVLLLTRSALAPILADDPEIAESLSRKVADRLASTVAAFDEQRQQRQDGDQASGDHRSILRRVRELFRLG